MITLEYYAQLLVSKNILNMGNRYMPISKRLTEAFNDRFGVLIENTEEMSQVASNLLEVASQLQEAISSHKRALKDAEIQLNNIVEQLNTKLGWEIRRRQPKLMVSHRNGCCDTGYYSKNLSFKPDLASKTWMVDGPLSRQFKREHPNTLQLANMPDLLANAVVDFFKNRFKTLG